MSDHQRNPYLKGEAPRSHISGSLRPLTNPLSSLSEDERAKVVKEVGNKARVDFLASVQRLQAAARSFNPLQLLAHFSYYDQLHLQHSDGKRGYMPTAQSAVEWLQALVLQLPEADLSAVINRSPTGEELHEVNRALHKAQESFGMMRLADKQEHDPTALAAEMIRQHTAFIRNEGYPSQIRRLHEEIFQPLDAAFRAREGISLSEVASFLWALLELIQLRINEDQLQRRHIIRQPNARRMIIAFAELIEQPVDQIKKDIAEFANDIDAVRNAITHWLDWRNFRFFHCTEEQLTSLFPNSVPRETVRNVLEQISITWGQLSATNPEHLLLDNPVWLKPLLAIGKATYCCPVIGLVQSFGLEIIEGLLQRHSDLWDRYGQEVRAQYLETRTEAAVRAAYPSAKVVSGLKWTASDGREYENDLVVLLDTQAIVFECKSGRVRARAQRGDPAALKSELEKLIGDPSRQGRRFADHLLAKRGVLYLQDTEGTKHELDLRRLIRTTLVNVSLDYVGHLGVQQRLIHQAKLIATDVPLAVTLPLHELENVLEILDRPAMSTHYFRRWGEITRANHMIADEMSMLALYLATAFDLGQTEGDDRHQFAVLGLGTKLDPYFMGRDLACPVPKPKLKLRGWWSDMLTQFDQKRFPGWIEASHALLAVGYERQEHFERQCKQLTRSVRSNWHQHNHNDTCVMVFGPTSRRTAIIHVVIKNRSKPQLHELVQDRMQRAVNEHGACQILVIAAAATERIYPYLGVYFHSDELQQLGDNSGFSFGTKPDPQPIP